MGICKTFHNVCHANPIWHSQLVSPACIGGLLLWEGWCIMRQLKLNTRKKNCQNALPAKACLTICLLYLIFSVTISLKMKVWPSPKAKQRSLYSCLGCPSWAGFRMTCNLWQERENPHRNQSFGPVSSPKLVGWRSKERGSWHFLIFLLFH